MTALKYMFSEPFKSQFERALRGIGLPDRSHYKESRKLPDWWGEDATANQIRELERLGSRTFPKTKGEASRMINTLKK